MVLQSLPLYREMHEMAGHINRGVPKNIRHTRYSLWRRTLSHNSLSCQISSVSSEELALPHSVNCPDFAATFTASTLNLCRIKRKENSSCSACGHPLQHLTHLLLDCPVSEPLRRAIFGTTSIFDLWSRCTVESLWSTSMPPSLGRSWVAPPPPEVRSSDCLQSSGACFIV